MVAEFSRGRWVMLPPWVDMVFGGGMMDRGHLSLVIAGKVDAEVTLSDSTAILVYLARKYSEEWIRSDALGQAQVQRWLSVALGEVATGPGAVRLIELFRAQLDLQAAVAKTHKLLALLELHLSENKLLAAQKPTSNCLPTKNAWSLPAQRNWINSNQRV